MSLSSNSLLVQTTTTTPPEAPADLVLASVLLVRLARDLVKPAPRRGCGVGYRCDRCCFALLFTAADRGASRKATVLARTEQNQREGVFGHLKS